MKLAKIDKFLQEHTTIKDINELDKKKLNRLINQDWFQRLFARYEACLNNSNQISKGYKRFANTINESSNEEEVRYENMYYKYANKSCEVTQELRMVLHNIFNDLKEGNL